MAIDGYKGQNAINDALGEVIFPETPRNQAHDPDQYRFEKVIGKRTPSGAHKLKRLTSRHKNIIALHLRCLSNRDISLVTGLNEVTVGNTLRDPLAQEVIQMYLAGVDEELHSLAPMAIDAVRSGLAAESVKTRLAAADRFFKATGRYADAEKGGETAEDVLARALARVAVDQSSQLRELNRGRTPKTIEHQPAEPGPGGSLSPAVDPYTRRQNLTLPSYDDGGGRDE